MTAAADSVLAGAAALASACVGLDGVRALFSTSLDALISRDRRDTPLPTRCVLVLDDEEGGRDSMRLLLAPLGVDVLTAATPAEARAVLVTGAVDLGALASIARGCCADLRERPITIEAQDALCALVASYLPPEMP